MRNKKNVLFALAILSALVLLFHGVEAVGADFSFMVFSDNRPGPYFDADYRNPQDWRAMLGLVKAQIEKPGPGRLPPKFLVGVGDIDPVCYTAYGIAKELGVGFPFYPIIGNHENLVPDREEIKHIVLNKCPNVVNAGPANCKGLMYSWDYENAHFVALNLYYDGKREFGRSQISTALLDWLEADLKRTEKPVIFVFGHEPVYPRFRGVGGNIDRNVQMRNKFCRLLKKYNVKAYFAGHTHFYDRLYDDGIWHINAGQVRGRVRPNYDLRNTVIQTEVRGDSVRFITFQSDCSKPSEFTVVNDWDSAEGETLAVDRGIQPLDVPVSWATRDKPQSKVWAFDGDWFGMFQVTDGFKVFKLEEDKWVDCSRETVEFDTSAKADCLSDGKDVYSLLVSEKELRLVRLTFAGDSYKVAAKVNITVPSAVETASIAMDSAGKIWIAGDEKDGIFVYSIDSALDAKNLEGPYVLALDVNDDDICAVTSFGSEKVGVFWSDQNRSMFGFKWHKDGEAFDKWSALEVIDDAKGCADDHINLKADSAGNIYAAVKTSFDDAVPVVSKVQIAFYYRTADGRWSDMITVVQRSDKCNPSRPMLQIDPENNSFYVFYTNYIDGSIEMTEAKMRPRKAIAFGRFSGPRKVLSSSTCRLNDVSGAKGITDGAMGMLIIAGGSRAIIESNLLALPPRF